MFKKKKVYPGNVPRYNHLRELLKIHFSYDFFKKHEVH
jgi:hypothetical protein